MSALLITVVVVAVSAGAIRLGRQTTGRHRPAKQHQRALDTLGQITGHGDELGVRESTDPLPPHVRVVPAAPGEIDRDRPPHRGRRPSGPGPRSGRGYNRRHAAERPGARRPAPGGAESPSLPDAPAVLPESSGPIDGAPAVLDDARKVLDPGPPVLDAPSAEISEAPPVVDAPPPVVDAPPPVVDAPLRATGETESAVAPGGPAIPPPPRPTGRPYGSVGVAGAVGSQGSVLGPPLRPADGRR